MAILLEKLLNFCVSVSFASNVPISLYILKLSPNLSCDFKVIEHNSDRAFGFFASDTENCLWKFPLEVRFLRWWSISPPDRLLGNFLPSSVMTFQHSKKLWLWETQVNSFPWCCSMKFPLLLQAEAEECPKYGQKAQIQEVGSRLFALCHYPFLNLHETWITTSSQDCVT